MSLKRLVIDGYGQLELNQVAFRRDGRIEAQCKIADGIEHIENGMLLAIDNVERVVKMPAGDICPIALNYTAEHMYDDRADGLKDFRLKKGEFLPRLGYLAIGDKFTTNCLCFDDGEFADNAALEKAYKVDKVKLYGCECAEGAIKVTKTQPENAKVVLVAIYGTGAGYMPDGQFGIKFQVVAV